MKQGFVLFGLRDKCGCTTNAIHIARYFANGGYSVSLVESANIKHPSLKNYIEGETIPYQREGVTIYPTWDQEVPDADIIIYDMGAVSMARILKMPRDQFEFILCATADEDTLFDLIESLTPEVKQLNPLILLKECGEIWVNKFKAINYRTFKVGYSMSICPTILADNLSQICHFAGIVAPEINYDLEEWIPINKDEPPKKLFNFVKSKKKGTMNEKSADIISNVKVNSDTPLEEDELLYDEDGLPIPEGYIPTSDLKPHERDKELFQKHRLITSADDASEGSEIEQLYIRTDMVGTADAKDKLKNTLDSAADISNSILKGISRLASKVIPVDNGEIKETEVVLTKEYKISKKQPESKKNNETKEITAISEQSDISDSDKSIKTEKNNETSVKNLFGKITKPFKDPDENDGCINIKIDKKTVDMILNEESSTNMVLAEVNQTIERETQSKLKFLGHLTIFVTALKHGAGCSHIAGIIGSSLVSSNNSVCFVHKKGTEYPSKKYICEYTGTEYDEAYNKAKIIIFDLGCLGELTKKELVELQRADIKVLVCGSNESDFQSLARFIHKCGSSAGDWIYAFNLVPGKKKRNTIKDLMQEYDYVFLPMCDYDDLPKELPDIWNKHIKKKLK